MHLNLPIRIDWKTLGQRLLFGAAVATLQNVASGGDTSLHGLGTSVGVGLLSSLPVAAQASGILRPTAPGQPSLAQTLVQAGVSIVQAPAAARRQALQQAIADAKPQIIAEALAAVRQTNLGGLGAQDVTAQGLAAGHAEIDAQKAGAQKDETGAQKDAAPAFDPTAPN